MEVGTGDEAAGDAAPASSTFSSSILGTAGESDESSFNILLQIQFIFRRSAHILFCHAV